MRMVKIVWLLVILLLSLRLTATQGPLALDDRAERPKLIKQVSPVYPPEALKQKIEGSILVEAVTSPEGKVIHATVIPREPRRPLLEAAALAAVQQWEYEPYLVDGRPKGVKFTVVVRFRLNGDDPVKPAPPAVEPPRPVDPIAPAERPRLVNRVAPVYPPEALKQGIQGRVSLAVRINEAGVVTAVGHDEKDPVDPLLLDAAVQAVRQWRYEPFIKDGQARPVAFTVMVTFRLDRDPPQKEQRPE